MSFLIASSIRADDLCPNPRLEHPKYSLANYRYGSTQNLELDGKTLGLCFALIAKTSGLQLSGSKPMRCKPFISSASTISEKIADVLGRSVFDSMWVVGGGVTTFKILNPNFIDYLGG